MGMSAWGLIITPVLIATDPSLNEAEQQAALDAYAPTAAEQYLDIFDELASLSDVSALDDAAMSTASGGADTAINIDNLGVNMAENNGSVSDVNVSNSTSGDVTDNIVTDNSGITTVFNNSGSGVLMQSIVNVNIFLQGAGPVQ